MILGHPLCPGRDIARLEASALTRAIERIHESGAQALIATTPVLLPGRAEALDPLFASALEAGADGFEVGDLGLMVHLRRSFPDTALITGPFMNAYNRATVRMLTSLGARSVCAACELDAASLAAMCDDGTPVSVTAYGRLPLAVGRDCLQRRLDLGAAEDECDPGCGGLPSDIIGWEADMAVVGTGLLPRTPCDLYDDLPALWGMGVRRFRIEALDRPAGLRDIIEAFSRALRSLEQGRALPPRPPFERGTNGFLWARAGRERVTERPALPRPAASSDTRPATGAGPAPVRAREPLSSSAPGLPALMAPAGGLEAAEAAFANGADGVYVGLQGWSLRPGVFEFDERALGEVVRLAERAHGWVATCVNIMPFPSDEQAALDAVARARDAGSHAVIVGDPGLLAAARERFPELRLHASVQLSAASAEAADVLTSLGADVVILSRSLMSTDEIAAIRARTRARLEVFVHGDVCTFHDGACYLTGYLKREPARPGQGHGLTPFVGCSNRGECTLVCKQPARLVSARGPRGVSLRRRDLNRSSWIGELCRLGIDILKIEGRQFDADYVATATRAYRRTLDDILRRAEGKGTEDLGKLDEHMAHRDISYAYQRAAWLGKAEKK